MSNLVLAETGPLSPSHPTMTLVHYGGARTVTRGTFAKLPQSEGELRGAFSESGYNVWVPTPSNITEVEFVIVNGVTWRALDEERILSAFTDPMLQYDTTRYQLVETTDVILPPVVLAGDFSPADFSAADFNTGA